MARYIIDNELEMVNDLQKFDYDGYAYDASLSTELKPVFTR